jgi:TRAP-type transport system periplasmic protein
MTDPSTRSGLSRGRFVAATSAALASIAVIKAPAQAAQWNYKYASNVNVDHPLNVRMRECWNAVKAQTKGRLDVQMFPNNQLGGDTQALQQLRAGALQFFTLDGGILQGVVPVAGIQAVGFAFKDSSEAFRAMDGALGDYVRDAIRGAGLYVHPKMWENGMRQITASSKPIRSAADLSGFKIRTPPGELWVDLFRSLGAAPAPLNFNEVYTALQTRVFDGQENPYAIIDTARLYEVQKYLSVTNHMWSAYHFLGNQDAWKELPPDVQGVVERNLTKYALLQRRDTQQRNDSLSEKLVRRGMTINRADTSGFRTKLSSSGFYTKWSGKFGAQAWALLEKSSGKLA